MYTNIAGRLDEKNMGKAYMDLLKEERENEIKFAEAKKAKAEKLLKESAELEKAKKELVGSLGEKTPHMVKDKGDGVLAIATGNAYSVLVKIIGYDK